MCAFVVVIQHTDTNPPVSSRAFESQDFSRLIAAGDVVGEFACGFLVGHASDLDGPFSERSGGGSGLHQLDLYLRDACLHQVDFPCGRERKVDDSSGNKRTTVGDPHQRSAPCLYVCDADDRAQGKGSMRGSHGVHVIDLAIRSATIVIRRPVPTGEACLGLKRLGSDRDHRFGEI